MHYIKVSGGNYIRDALDVPATYVGTAKRILVHPEYNDVTFNSDIALVEVLEGGTKIMNKPKAHQFIFS